MTPVCAALKREKYFDTQTVRKTALKTDGWIKSRQQKYIFKLT